MTSPESHHLLGLSTSAITALIVLGLILIAAVWFIWMFNRLVQLRQSCRESWADIDTELQRRHDLMPNLVDTVKGYANHEKGVLDDVTRLRQQAVSLKDELPSRRAKIEEQFALAGNRLVATFESYPDLKANQNFLQLQKELSETETRIARSRRFYNANVRSFKNGVQMFPNSLVAMMGRFGGNEFEYFQADAKSTEPINVDLGDT